MNVASDVDSSRSLGDYAAILRRRWRLLVALVPSSLLLAIFIAYSMEPLYQASATVLLEEAVFPREVVRTAPAGTTVQQVELVQRRVMSRSRIETILNEVDPYPGSELSAEEKAGLVSDNTSFQMVDPITLKPLPDSPAFSIHYLNPDPVIARDVARALANLFFAYSRETRQEQASETREFLQSRVKEIDTQIRDAESRLAEFKQLHGSALPETQLRNEAALERTLRDLDGARAQVRLLEQQEQLLRLQLSQINPNLVATTGNAYTDINQVRAELAAAQQRGYTAEHPDIKRLQRALESLIAQGQGGRGSQVAPDNPDYLRVSAELTAVRTNLAAQRSVVARGETQIAGYERSRAASPEVERDYVAMLRERDVLQQQFIDLQSKLQQAEVAQSVETEDRGQRYTLIRAPSLPTSPASPNRIGIILLGLVLGGGLAVALAIMREGADPTVRDLRDIPQAGNVAVLGSVPLLLNDEDRRRRRVGWIATGAAYSLAVIVVAFTVLRA